MKAEEVFVFKGIERKEAYEFDTAEGKHLKVPASYTVKFDEKVNGIIYSREVKVKDTKENSDLIEKLKSIEPYKACLMQFNVSFYQKTFNLALLDIEALEEN